MEGVFALLDMLLGGAAPVVEPDHPVRLHRQIGDDEADTREQLARMPFDLGDHAALFVPGGRLIVEILEEPFDLGQRWSPHGPRQPMRDLFAQDVVGRQPNGVEVACLFQTFVDRGDRIGCVRPEEPAPKVAARIARNDRIENISPAVGAVDVAVSQGAAFQHAELVEQKVGVVAGAVEMPVPSGPLLIAVSGADRAVHVQHDELQPVAVMELVDPLAVQLGKRFPVLGQGQRLGLEPPHLGSRGRLRLDSPATHNLAHDRINRETVGVVDVLVSGQPPEHRLPKQPIKPVDGVLPPAGISQHRRRQIRQPKRVIQLAHHQKAAIGTDLSAAKFQPHPAVKIDPITPIQTRTLWVIHEKRPSQPSTP